MENDTNATTTITMMLEKYWQFTEIIINEDSKLSSATEKIIIIKY